MCREVLCGAAFDFLGVSLRQLKWHDRGSEKRVRLDQIVLANFFAGRGGNESLVLASSQGKLGLGAGHAVIVERAIEEPERAARRGVGIACEGDRRGCIFDQRKLPLGDGLPANPDIGGERFHDTDIELDQPRRAASLGLDGFWLGGAAFADG